MKYTPEAKLRLQLGILVMQRFGKQGTIEADKLLKEMPIGPEFDKDKFMAEVEKRCQNTATPASK